MNSKLRWIQTISFALLICVLFCACQTVKTPGPDPEQETPADPSEQTPEVTAPQDPEPEETDREKIVLSSASTSSYVSYVSVPRNICYTMSYVIVARATDYLGGIYLDSREEFRWRLGTLMQVENLENMKGNLILGALPIVKAGGINEELTGGMLWEPQDYYPEIGTYWLLLLGAPKIGGLYTESVGIYMFPLAVDPALEPEEALEQIHKDETYLKYLDGVQNQEKPDPELYNEDEIVKYHSVFEEDSEEAERRDSFFTPDFVIEDQAELLPHEPVNFRKDR